MTSARDRPGWIRGHERGLGLPAAELGVAGDRCHGARETAPSGLVHIGGEQQASGERARVGTLLIGDPLGEHPGEGVILARRVRQVLGPRPGKTQAAGLLLDVGGQTRLADAGFADEQDDAASTGPAGRFQGLPEAFAVRCPPDEQARPGAPHQAVKALAAEPMDPDRHGPAADRVLAHDVDLQALAGGPERRVVEQDLAGLGQLLEAHRGRHGVAGDHEVRPVADFAHLGHHLARRDADAEPERWLATGPGHVIHRRGHREAAEGGPQRIVVVCPAGAEHGEDRIPDELLDDALVSLDGTGQQPEGLIDPADDLFGIELGHEARVVHDVREQGGHDPAIAGNRRAGGQAPGALVAEARGRRIRRAARRAAHRPRPTPLPIHPAHMVRPRPHPE